MSFSKPRGLRNNNPLNIRRTRDKWVGLHPVQDDKEFFVFESLYFGFRAAAIILMRYYYIYKLRDIDSIIARWAPETENHTINYISYVRGRLSVLRPDVKELPAPRIDHAYWTDMMFSMAGFENGVDPNCFEHLRNKMIDVFKSISMI